MCVFNCDASDPGQKIQQPLVSHSIPGYLSFQIRAFQLLPTQRKRLIDALFTILLSKTIHISLNQVKVAKTVLLLIAVYIITWIPICVIHFLRVAKIGNIPDPVDLAAAFLMSMSCVTNPWIYGFRNSHFRDQLRRMLCLKTRVTRIMERQESVN